MKTIYLVRHGQTQANAEQYLGGRDELLSAVGEKQAAVVGQRLESLSADTLLASDWPRAQQTAKIISEMIGLDVETVPDLGEHMIPLSLKNKSYEDDTYAEYKKACAEHWGDPNFRVEDAENYHDLFARAERLRIHLETIDSEVIIAVSHSRFLRFFTAYMTMRDTLTAEAELHMSTVLRPKNTSITGFTFDKGQWTLFTWGDQAHFAD
jgi:probable phosphoglycerate mutase